MAPLSLQFMAIIVLRNKFSQQFVKSTILEYDIKLYFDSDRPTGTAYATKYLNHLRGFNIELEA